MVAGGGEGARKQAEELNSARAKHNISSTWSDVRGTLTLSLSLSAMDVHSKDLISGISLRKVKASTLMCFEGARRGRRLSRGGGGVTLGLFCSNYFSAKFKFGQILQPNMPVGLRETEVAI